MDKDLNLLLSPNDRKYRKRMERRRRERARRILFTVMLVLIIIPIIICIVLSSKVKKLESELQQYKDDSAKVAQQKNESKVAVATKEPAATKTDTAKDNKDTKATKDANKDNKDSKDNKDDDVKRVYLTFDDGPSKYTPEILDILDKYDVKATFFVVGQSSDYSKKMMKEIVDRGHTIAMHSYCHDYGKLYKSVDAFSEDFEKIYNLIYDATGVKPKYYRFPGGSSTTTAKIGMQNFIDFLDKKGIDYFDWNAQNGDATGKTLSPDELISNVLGDVKKYKTSMVLMHDHGTKHNTVDSLPKLIKELKKLDAVMPAIDDDTPLIQHVKDANKKDDN